MPSDTVSGGFDAVVIASSAGGLPALFTILGKLPGDFPAPILLVQHISPLYPTRLPDVISSRSALPAKLAEPGEPLRRSMVYLAPPDYHFMVTTNGAAFLSQSGKVCFTRPAADPLFLSAAVAYRERAVGVVLSGRGNDGAMGSRAIKALGGVTIAQDPASCEWADMPQSAIATGCVDLVLTPPKIASALVTFVMVKGASVWLQSPAFLG